MNEGLLVARGSHPATLAKSWFVVGIHKPPPACRKIRQGLLHRHLLLEVAPVCYLGMGNVEICMT